jgi:hypothetical protein
VVVPLPALEETSMNVAAILKLKGRTVVNPTADKSLLNVAQSCSCAFLWKQGDYFNITTIDDFLGRGLFGLV